MTDTSGLIDPAQFPAKSAGLDPSLVRESARSARAMGKTADDETRAINTTWSGLGAHYEAPEQQQVYDVMRPAVTSAGDLKNAFGSMAAYLDTYAAALDGIKARLSDFEGRATAFRASVVGGVQVDASEAKDAGFGEFFVGAFDWVPGVDESQVSVPWYEDSATVQKNSDLLGEYAQLLADISTASTQCANDINRLVENSCVAVVDAIPAEAFTNPEQPMPWGAPRDEDRNCPESVGHGTYEFGAGMAEGAGMLVLGYNPESGDFFDGSSYGQAWGGLGNLVGSIALMASPAGIVAAGMAVTGKTDNEFFEYMGERSEVVVGGLGSLVGYDINAEDGWHKWKEDGVAAGTGAVLSIGTFFIPGVGEVGAGLKAGSMGAKVARIAAVTADVAVQGGGWLVKGGLRVATGLRSVLRFGDDVLPSVERAGQAGAAARISPAALIAAVDDLPQVHVTPPKPVSVELFGPSRVDPSGNSVLEPPVARVDSSAEHLDPPAQHVDPPAGRVDPPAQQVDPARGPVWSSDTLADGRPDVSTVPQTDWADPRVDPSSLHYDGTPRGDHGNVGTVDPDVLSPSGLTNNGRLIDPTVVPPELQHYIDAGVIVNDDGVLRLHDSVDVTFTLKNEKHDLGEFLRQGDLQERSLKQQSVGDWSERIASYDANGRVEGRAQTNYRTEQIRLQADALEVRNGMAPDAALAQAQAQAKGMDVLHGPDQVAGGNPLQFTGLGDRGVNRAYGWGWGLGGNSRRLQALMDETLQQSGIPDGLLGDIRMNVNIKVLVARP